MKFKISDVHRAFQAKSEVVQLVAVNDDGSLDHAQRATITVPRDVIDLRKLDGDKVYEIQIVEAK